MSKKKKTPNPNGKKGGKLHRNKINKIEEDIVDRNLLPDTEHFFKNTKGKSRFADIVGVDEDGKLAEIHQAGKQNKNGTPVKRERDAMKDIEQISGIKVIFHPYNLLILMIVAIVILTGVLIF